MFTTDAAGRLHLYIIDFEHASFLPVSFLSTALIYDGPRWLTGEPLLERIGHTLPRHNQDAKKAAGYIFYVSAPSVGLLKSPTPGTQVVDLLAELDSTKPATASSEGK
jgi:hypothetical protein